MRGTLLAAFAVAAMVLVAGCTGSGGPADGGETTPAVDGTTTAPDGTATRTPAGGEDGREGAGAPRYTHFDFEEEESYRYDVMLGDERGTLLWEVREVDGDRVTVHLEFDFRATFETTVTGDRANIRRKLADTQFGELVTSGLLSPYDTILQDRTLELGERWSATTTEGSANVTVTETNTYAGVECQTTEVRVDGEVRYTACLSPRLGLVVHSSVTPEGEAGGTSVEFELVEVGTGAGGTSTPTPTATPTPTPTVVPTSTVTPAPTATPTSEPGVWRVRVEYDGRWSGTVTVTTDRGRSTRAFTGDGDRTIDVDAPLDVDPQGVRSITATAEKRADDGRTLRVTILKNGEVVAEASTDAPSGDTVVSHHE